MPQADRAIIGNGKDRIDPWSNKIRIEDAASVPSQRALQSGPCRCTIAQTPDSNDVVVPGRDQMIGI